MRAMDVMTTNVITVSPDTSVQDVAKTLSERSISGVPVVDAQNRAPALLVARHGRVGRGARARLRQIARPHRQRRHDERGYLCQ